MNDTIHQIKMEFHVTPEIKRYVYLYLIVGKHIYLIDSGVAGAEVEVERCLHRMGRSIRDIEAIFLTHAHPDHIGGAAKIKEQSGCRVYASRGEAAWIEDIDRQFQERPIPNFYTLVNQSVSLDGLLQDGDVARLEPGLTLQVIGTPGHSCDEVSYLLPERRSIFTGDTIPVKGDIPIWINDNASRASLERLAATGGVDKIYPAWDETYEMLFVKFHAFHFPFFNQIKRRYSINYSDALSVRLFYPVPSVMITGEPVIKEAGTTPTTVWFPASHTHHRHAYVFTRL